MIDKSQTLPSTLFLIYGGIAVGQFGLVMCFIFALFLGDKVAASTTLGGMCAVGIYSLLMASLIANLSGESHVT